MPLFHCTKCHHEWEDSSSKESFCDWCKDKGIVAEGRIIAEKTDMEKVDWVQMLGRLRKLSEESVRSDEPIFFGRQKGRSK